jgi:NAD(P)-dependent dehydrogenase (short-subunit alcohol dehydrogenase family)
MPTQKSVVITGASTGIGRACALHMDALGWHVFAGVRREADAESLRREASGQLTPIFLDVTDARSIREAHSAVETSLGASGLAGLVNNAGIAYGGPVELLDLDELRRAFEVNFFGLIAVTQAFLPLLRAGRGRVVNMSSVSGMVASPFLSPYTTSKWALEALSDALRVELEPWDIKVSVVQPGAIDTPIWSKGLRTANTIRERVPNERLTMYAAAVSSIEAGLQPHGIAPEYVARAVADALASGKPRTRYTVGKDAAIVRLFQRLPDRIRDAFFLRRLRRRH